MAVFEARAIRLRYRAICSGCGTELPPRTEAVWDRAARACLTCADLNGNEPAPTAERPSAALRLERGEAGSSARRKHQRLHERREKQAREKLGPLSNSSDFNVVHRREQIIALAVKLHWARIRPDHLPRPPGIDACEPHHNFSGLRRHLEDVEDALLALTEEAPPPIDEGLAEQLARVVTLAAPVLATGRQAA